MASGSSSRLYPEIISDEQRRRYKSEFDSDLSRYKALCAEMDQLSDQIHQLSRELDGLDADSAQYQVKKSSQLYFCLFVCFCDAQSCVLPFFREWQTSATDSKT